MTYCPNCDEFISTESYSYEEEDTTMSDSMDFEENPQPPRSFGKRTRKEAGLTDDMRDPASFKKIRYLAPEIVTDIYMSDPMQIE